MLNQKDLYFLKNSQFILSERSDFYIIVNLSIADHALHVYVDMFSVDEILLLRSMNWSTNFRGLAFSKEMALSWLVHNPVYATEIWNWIFFFFFKFGPEKKYSLFKEKENFFPNCKLCIVWNWFIFLKKLGGPFRKHPRLHVACWPQSDNDWFKQIL